MNAAHASRPEILKSRTLLAAVSLSINSLTLAYGEEPAGFGVLRTNAELMAAAQTSTAAPAGARGVDVPLERFATSLPRLLELNGAAAATGTGGLRVDLTFVGATGQRVPDTMGAVGPTQYLVVLNSVVRSFRKATGVQDAVLDLSLSQFFAPVNGGQPVAFDPKVRFDRLSGRWFVAAIQGGTPSRFLLAVSSSGVLLPQSTWTFFSVQQDQVSPAGDTGCAVDYTRMSVDANAVYFVFAMFTADLKSGCPTNATMSTAFIIRKTSVLGAGPVVATAFRGAGYFQVPADQFDSTSTVGYITSFHPTQSGSYYRVIDPGGTPSLSAEVPFSGLPALGGLAPVRHKGNALESGVPSDYSGRMFLGNGSSHSVPVRRGRLWLASLVGVNSQGTASDATRNGLGFSELQNLTLGSPSVVQNGLLFAPSPLNDYDQRNYWIPALMVNGQGHMLLAGSAAGSNEYINAAVAGRLATDPPGTLRAPILYTNATETYTGPPDPSRLNTRRWGDYSDISLDPCDDMTMWAIEQFAVSGPVWGVAVARVKAPPPPSVWSVSPRALPRNVSSVNVTISGTPTDGEGFYDPGPGFGCRVTAAIDGGVTVNAVTYNSPTSITLNVSTVGASNAAHALTITNPDGQSVTMPAALIPRGALGDVDGDGTADVTVYRPATGTWYVLRSGTNYTSYTGYQWGVSTDLPVPGDYDGDGKSDIAVYRPATGLWYVLLSSTNSSTFVAYQWGLNTDTTVPSDYDGDGKTDVAVYRPATGVWYVLLSTTNSTSFVSYRWGASTDMPVPGDYDGDGKADLAVFRPGTGDWHILESTTNLTTSKTVQWGASTDVPVPGDYDGDGKADVAIFRPGTGTWHIRESGTNFATFKSYPFGGGTDKPVAADYDGDGKTDVAVYRPANGVWYSLLSTTNWTSYVSYQWGASTDIPITSR